MGGKREHMSVDAKNGEKVESDEGGDLEIYEK